MTHLAYIDGTSQVNDKLCSFGNRWQIDGDYMRCRKCKRPQITNYMDAPFPHADGCKPSTPSEPHPWRTFLGLMDELRAATLSAEKEKS